MARGFGLVCDEEGFVRLEEWEGFKRLCIWPKCLPPPMNLLEEVLII